MGFFRKSKKEETEEEKNVRLRREREQKERRGKIADNLFCSVAASSLAASAAGAVAVPIASSVVLPEVTGGLFAYAALGSSSMVVQELSQKQEQMQFDRDVRQYGSKVARQRLRERTEAERARNAESSYMGYGQYLHR